MLQNYILMSSVQMNQKHMDSISLGIHMGLKTKRVGVNVFEEEHFRSQQMPHICKQQFEVCGDCIPGWAPHPQQQHGQDVLQWLCRVCTWEKTPQRFVLSLVSAPCLIHYGGTRISCWGFVPTLSPLFLLQR